MRHQRRQAAQNRRFSVQKIHKKVCVIRGYALSEVCVKRGSTVPPELSKSYAFDAALLMTVLGVFHSFMDTAWNST
jgi:hypothetical protein